MSCIRNETAYNDISGGLLMHLDGQILFCIRDNKITKSIYQFTSDSDLPRVWSTLCLVYPESELPKSGLPESGQPWRLNILPFLRYETTYDHLIYLFVQMILNKLHIEMVFLENVLT